VANRRPAITLVKGAGSPAAMGSGPGYGAYLGTVPDFAPVERGVRFSGVTPDSPADRAGLEAGDVLVGFAGREIADLYAFTDALRAHRPGERVRLTVLREGREVTVEAVLGSRN
jgi:S1-C subfamily serine protease